MTGIKVTGTVDAKVGDVRVTMARHITAAGRGRVPQARGCESIEAQIAETVAEVSFKPRAGGREGPGYRPQSDQLLRHPKITIGL